jgi:hypothetical protein
MILYGVLRSTIIRMADGPIKVLGMNLQTAVDVDKGTKLHIICDTHS